jgi:HlyD family secretion protein
MTRRKKYWIGAGALVLLLAVLGLGIAKRRGEGATAVETEVIGTRELVSIVTASGEIQPQRSVDVHANINGTIERVAVREGQEVKEGDFLLQIDPVSMEAASEAQAAQVRASERDVEGLRAELEQARRDLRRARELASRELISQEELQRAETAAARAAANLSAAQARVQQALANLKSSRHELSKVTVTAPRSGTITRLDVEEGEFAFSTGLSPTLLLTIADLSTMQAEIEVDETDVVNVKLDQPAKITVDAFPDTSFTGTVTEVGTSPILAEGSDAAQSQDAKDFEVVVVLKELLPAARAGLSATADIETARQPGAVALPIQSLVVRELPRPKIGEAPPDTLEPGEETEGVFVVREGKAHFVPIRVGITGDRFFEVKEGVAPGDTVVSGSYEVLRDLQDGDPVRVIPPDKKKRRERRGTDGEEEKEG